MNYEYEVNIDKSYKDKETDEWGCAFLWLDDDHGVEYNYCVDSFHNRTMNCSAIYATYMDHAPAFDDDSEMDRYMETDTSKYVHYEIDFDDDEWKEKLVVAMLKAAYEFWNVKKPACLNCGYEYPKKIYMDELGAHAVCPCCGSIYDI